MPETRLGGLRLWSIVGLSALTLGIGLGGSGRLTYHEAFVAQAAREMIAQGTVLVPTIDGRPWLEKPPLAFWLVALAGRLAGGVNEFVARVPSAVAATLLTLGLAVFAARRFGPDVGWLAGLVQASTFWLVVRGRLAEADIVLACLVTWTMVAFDRIRTEDSKLGVENDGIGPKRSPRSWRWAFFALLGASSLVKGLGFGVVLVGSVVASVILWDRDRSTFRALLSIPGWALASVLAMAWPVLVVLRLPAAVSLWTLHVTDRLASHPEHFIGGPWWQYGPSVLGQCLPWTPLALVVAWPSMLRSLRDRGGVDRLLWAWAVVPILVLSMATVKNAHYAIYALPPMAVWSALGLVQLGDRLVCRRRFWSPGRIRFAAGVLFVGLGLGWGLGHLGVGPRYDRRGGEWAWCGRVARAIGPDVALVFLYEDWDRKPYPTPFGPVPHDWAVRLFYLERPAFWRQGVDDLAARPPSGSDTPYALLGRDRDLPALRQLGAVETLQKGPADRFDREFTLFRVTPTARR